MKKDKKNQNLEVTDNNIGYEVNMEEEQDTDTENSDDKLNQEPKDCNK